MNSLPYPLRALERYPQFIICKLVWDDVKKKNNKIPLNWRTLKAHDAHDTGIHLAADQALPFAAALGQGYLPAFVFLKADPFFFLDIDNCYRDGAWSPLAIDLCGKFNGAAVEVSQSGTGLHIFGVGTPPAHACKNVSQGLELYTEGRFVALSMLNAVGDIWTDHSAALQTAVSQYFPPAAHSGEDLSDWTDYPCEEWLGPEDDLLLLQKAQSVKSAASIFGDKASFRDLFLADEEKLARAYPGGSDKPYDASSADMALAQHLAFWTGKNCERIETLMKMSSLVRPKWDREDYLKRTILRACARQEEVAQGKKPEELKAVPAILTENSPLPEEIEGDIMVPVQQQAAYFAGCVYIGRDHKVLVPGGWLLNKDQFNVTYGGRLFALDKHNEKLTDDAWKVFTGSKAIRFPRARAICFRPDFEPGVIIEDAGTEYANSYWPVKTKSQQADITPFMDHLCKVLPVKRDRDILLAYMAAIVQHKGVKFQWCPLIQGAEGNGKTLFSRCVEKAVGERYSHWPRPDQLTEKFNSWIFGKVFIGVEDIHVPGEKKEILEALKPMITNDRLERRAMNQDQTTEFVCGNFMLNSNHKDAIRKTKNDRRFCVMYSAQQTKEDIERDGMGERSGYFPRLYDWLKKEGGYAAVTHFLETYDIPDELNPAIECHRAPLTSSTDEAVTAGLGTVEQHIQEAIDQGKSGFAGGWVSSIALQRLLEELHFGGRVAPNKRREMMQSLGYDWHPALKGGRSPSIIAIDGGRPILYIHPSSPDFAISLGILAARAYSAAQSKMIEEPVIL